ncbi:TetR/AcrR family transcriptional regulator [Pokkaliibacter sp. MBI-7]|uniref:TetR/AcrR family transcriptional regulator n=1 Tax=Pokkaliibacter sp. MBI-7 TaxID=3040600 RepID=UPI00244C8210|nr:TetR/AcrR family transcriptional regulator [Pokkaliibacter sp. MBI-7]MDH2431780.1 TetR/AcrR family transcriptional regulator [Pokkaliibacter sp. MBI-7]
MRVKSETRRKAIIQGAADVFLEKGYAPTVMAEIASRVGVSKPTLYGYFPSKEELFLEVIKTLVAERLSSAFEPLIEGQELSEILQTFGQQFLTNVLKPEIVTLRGILMTEAQRTGIGPRLYKEGPGQEVDKLAFFLAKEMLAGRLRPGKPETAAAHLLGMLEGEYQDFLLGATDTQPTAEQIAQSVDDAVAIFLRGYAP